MKNDEHRSVEQSPPRLSLRDYVRASTYPDDFLHDVLEKKPLVGRMPSCEVNLDDFIEISSHYLRSGQLSAFRFISRERPLDIAVIAEKIGIESFVDISAVELRRLLLNGDGISMAFQGMHEGVPDLLDWVDEIAQYLETRVESTIFFSPGNSSSTPLHYDASDVFALQLCGRKIWRIFEPIVYLPETGTGTFLVPSDKKLRFWGAVTLEPGQFIYLPRGWIHKVENVTDFFSLHVSLSAFFTSRQYLFKQLVNEAFSSAISGGSYEQHISYCEAVNGNSTAVLSEMLTMFGGALQGLASNDVSRFLKYSRLTSEDRAYRSAAQDSVKLLNENSVLRRTPVRFTLRHSDLNYEISVDGTNYYQISRDIVNFALSNVEFRIIDLNNSDIWEEEEAIRFLEVGIHRLGLWEPIM